MNPTHIGLVAGFLTSVAAVPQVVKSYRSRHVRDISIWQPVLLTAGMALWLIYGILLNDLPLIAANIFSLACYVVLTVMKIVYREDDPDRRNDSNNKAVIKPKEEP
jgi:MtN3 and saliva related transmembrane protein